MQDVGTDIIPEGERGKRTIRPEDLWRHDATTLNKFQDNLLREAARRGLVVSIIDPPEVLGGVTLAWEPGVTAGG